MSCPSVLNVSNGGPSNPKLTLKINSLRIKHLTNRYQYVSLGQTDSELLSVSCGVPQGSVLGPLLFLIYISMILVTAQKF